jgi:hypothetical protein
MVKHHLAVLVFKVLIESKPGCRLSQHGGKRRLTHRQRIAPQVVAVELDQVEGVEEHADVAAAVTKVGMLSSPQATASPSMMQERERRRTSASTINGKRRVRSLPGRL